MTRAHCTVPVQGTGRAVQGGSCPSAFPPVVPGSACLVCVGGGFVPASPCLVMGHAPPRGSARVAGAVLCPGGCGGGEAGREAGGQGRPVLCTSPPGGCGSAQWSLGMGGGAREVGRGTGRGPQGGDSSVLLPPLHGQQGRLPLLRSVSVCCSMGAAQRKAWRGSLLSWWLTGGAAGWWPIRPRGLLGCGGRGVGWGALGLPLRRRGLRLVGRACAVPGVLGVPSALSGGACLSASMPCCQVPRSLRAQGTLLACSARALWPPGRQGPRSVAGPWACAPQHVEVMGEAEG